MDFFRPRADICTCASRYLMASRSWHAAHARATLNVQENMEQNHFKFGQCLIARQELLVPTAAAPFASTFIVNTWKCVCQLSRAPKIKCQGKREATNRGICNTLHTHTTRPVVAALSKPDIRVLRDKVPYKLRVQIGAEKSARSGYVHRYLFYPLPAGSTSPSAPVAHRSLIVSWQDKASGDRQSL